MESYRIYRIYADEKPAFLSERGLTRVKFNERRMHRPKCKNAKFCDSSGNYT